MWLYVLLSGVVRVETFWDDCKNPKHLVLASMRALEYNAIGAQVTSQ